MKLNAAHKSLASAVLGGLLFAWPCPSLAQDDADQPPVRLRVSIPIYPFDRGMTQIDPPASEGKPEITQPASPEPEPRRSMISSESTATGTLFRYSDGSTLELKREYSAETLKNGTKIEKLPEGTTIVRWPNGAGIVRNPDGTGAAFNPDPREPSRSGDLTPVPGTVEVLPTGVVRQELKDDGVVLDRFPDGTIRSRPDLVKKETTTMDQPTNKSVSTMPLNPLRTSMEKKADAPKLIPIMKPRIVR